MREERKRQLRAMAESLLAQGYIKPREGETDLAKILEELSVYEAELEAQNNELIESNLRVDQQLKEQETLFNQAPIAYCLLDDGQKIQRQNMAAIKLYGATYNTADMLFYRLYRTGDDSARLTTWLVEEDDSKLVLEYATRTSTAWHELHKHQYPDGRLLIAIVDVTDQINHRNELKKLADELLEANHTKDRFLATMSHEIRTPLTGIMGYIDILDDGDLDEDTQDKIQHMRVSAQGLLEILNDVLNVSKLNADKYPCKEETFNIRYLIHKLEDMFIGRLINTNVNLEIDISTDIDSHIYSEPRLIRQIIVNLVGNSVKFTDKGTIRLVIRKLHESNKDFLHFIIEDTGTGLGDSNLEELFDEFTQHRVAKVSQQGTGLGLAICKKFVDLMHGEIKAENRANGGSRFWFKIPYITVDFENQEPREKFSKEQLNEPMSILAVDDNQTNRLIIKAIIEKNGHQCEVVESGSDALAAFKYHDYDLIIMDKRMPHMNGIETAEAIRSSVKFTEKPIPIVCWTAELTFAADLESQDLPFEGFLNKPIDQKDLLETLYRYHPINQNTKSKNRPD